MPKNYFMRVSTLTPKHAERRSRVAQRGELILPLIMRYKEEREIFDSSATTSSGFPQRFANLSKFSPNLVRVSVTGLPPACLVPTLIFKTPFLTPPQAAYLRHLKGLNLLLTSTPHWIRTSNLRFRRPMLYAIFCQLSFRRVIESIESVFCRALPAAIDKFFWAENTFEPRVMDCDLSCRTEAGYWRKPNDEKNPMFWKKRFRLMDWLNTYASERSLRFESKRQFEISVELFLQFVKKDFFVDQFNENLLSDFVRHYSRKVSPTTARNKRTALLALWRSASDAGHCSPPSRRVQSVRVQHQPVQAWRVDQVREIIHQCRQLKRNHTCGLRRFDWWEVAVRVAWDSGLRWGDQMQLNVSAITADGGTSIVQSKTNRVVYFRLSESTLAVLHRTLEECPRALVTPWDCSQQSFNDQFRRIVRNSGVQAGTWKWLRRGSATDVESNHPGCGAAHLGHVPGSPIAERHYFDQTILQRDSVSPTDL
jgi:integrase